MNKKELSEADIRTKFIMPALDKDKQGTWDTILQIREAYGRFASIHKQECGWPLD
jgi:hypothetical protein